MNPLVVGYFADGPWAHRAFDRLVADPTIRVAFVCTRFDQPDAELAARARVNDIECFSHSRINSDEFFEMIRGFGCDLFVSMSFNQIFKRRLFEFPRLRTINCHAGKLPFYRGRNILNWVLINDEEEFGITVHYIDDGIDTGDVLAQKTYPISDADSYATLLQKAYLGCAELLYEAIKQLQSGLITAWKQSTVHPLGSYCTKRVPGDERIDWSQGSREVFNFVRAICRPGPEARTLSGETEIKINRVEFLPEAPEFRGIPGAILGPAESGFLVKTGDSFIKVIEWSGAERIRLGERLK